MKVLNAKRKRWRAGPRVAAIAKKGEIEDVIDWSRKMNDRGYRE
jgi:hypothetical protein